MQTVIKKEIKTKVLTDLGICIIEHFSVLLLIWLFNISLFFVSLWITDSRKFFYNCKYTRWGMGLNDWVWIFLDGMNRRVGKSFKGSKNCKINGQDGLDKWTGQSRLVGLGIFLTAFLHQGIKIHKEKKFNLCFLMNSE